MVAARSFTIISGLSWRRLGALLLALGLAIVVQRTFELHEEQRAYLDASRLAAEKAREEARQDTHYPEYNDALITELFNAMLVPPFAKLDASGRELDLSADNWQCARSNDSNLIWEVKTGDGGLRDGQFTYSWFTPGGGDRNPISGRVDGGNCLYSNCDTQSYIDIVNERGLCGLNNWRLPSAEELESIVLERTYIPKIDSRFFPHAQSYYYWSNTIYANYYDPEKYAHFPGVQAFQYWSEILSINDYSLMTSVNFLNGLPYGARKSRNYHIRLVSDG